MKTYSYNLWSVEELDFLTEMYKSIPASKIAKELNRSEPSVFSKLKYLGLDCKDNEINSRIKSGVNEIRSANPRASKAAMARRLGCTKYRINKALEAPGREILKRKWNLS